MARPATDSRSSPGVRTAVARSAGPHVPILVPDRFAVKISGRLRQPSVGVHSRRLCGCRKRLFQVAAPGREQQDDRESQQSVDRAKRFHRPGRDY